MWWYLYSKILICFLYGVDDGLPFASFGIDYWFSQSREDREDISQALNVATESALTNLKIWRISMCAWRKT